MPRGVPNIVPNHYQPRLTQLHRVAAVWAQVAITPDDHFKRSAVIRLCEVLAPVEVNRIAMSDIARYVEHRRRHGASPAGINMDLGVLKHLLEWCHRNRIVGAATSEIVQRYRHLEKTDGRRDRTAGSA